MKKIKFYVTQRNINQGRVSCMSCPIALGLNDSGWFAWVEVNKIELFIRSEEPVIKKYVCKSVPDELKRFITMFDEHGQNAVQPTSFELEIE